MSVKSFKCVEKFFLFVKWKGRVSFLNVTRWVLCWVPTQCLADNFNCINCAGLTKSANKLCLATFSATGTDIHFFQFWPGPPANQQQPIGCSQSALAAPAPNEYPSTPDLPKVALQNTLLVKRLVESPASCWQMVASHSSQQSYLHKNSTIKSAKIAEPSPSQVNHQ